MFTQRANQLADAATPVCVPDGEAVYGGDDADADLRFTGDDHEVLAQRAALRADELRVRHTTIEGHLADIGRDQRLVVIEVAALVRDVLGNL